MSISLPRIIMFFVTVLLTIFAFINIKKSIELEEEIKKKSIELEEKIKREESLNCETE